MSSRHRTIAVHTAPLLLASLVAFLWASQDGWSGSLNGVSSLRTDDHAASSLRLGILETDFWQESLSDGQLHPTTFFPAEDRWEVRWQNFWSKHPAPLALMHGANFTPASYLAQVEALAQLHPGNYDVLLYYGGWRPSKNPHGLNFNSWSLSELIRLRDLNARPFIGLETFDHGAVRLMTQRLSAAGYSIQDPMFVRIAAEPSSAAYGTETGTVTGARHTPRSHELYKTHFAETAELLRALARREHLNIKIVFAGDSLADFRDYLPDASSFDMIGLDLYVTPANHDQKLALLSEVSKRWPHKPLVLAELGIATAGPDATPAWARTALSDVLEIVGRHPAGAAQITVFSVDVASRLRSRRWNWAWTPAMYQMLAEWQSVLSRWHPKGFHRYDVTTYPVGRDILYHHSSMLKLYYRRLHADTLKGEPLFMETLFRLEDGRWHSDQRQVAWIDNKIIPIDQLRPETLDANALTL